MKPFSLLHSGCPVAGATTSSLPFSFAAASTMADTMKVVLASGSGRFSISPCLTLQIPFVLNLV